MIFNTKRGKQAAVVAFAAVLVVSGVGPFAAFGGLVDSGHGGIASASHNATIDSFEDQDISEYEGDTGSFSVVDAQSKKGDYSLKSTTSGVHIGSTSGLDYYPESGDNFTFYIRFDQVDDHGSILFAVQNAGSPDQDNYYVSLNTDASNLRLAKREGGTNTVLEDQSASIPVDTWIRVEVEWGSNGFINATAYNGTNVVGVANGTDTTWTDGGVGFKRTHASSGGATWYDGGLVSSSSNPEISGSVTDSNGGISNATVEVVNTSTGTTNATATTDGSGAYNVYVDPREYDVTVSNTSYSNKTKAVDVSDGSSAVVDFSLGSSSSGYSQEFELEDHTGQFDDATLTVDESLKEYGITAPAGSSDWTTIETTGFNHNQRAWADLEETHVYRVRVREGDAEWQRAGIKGDADRGTYVLEIGENTTENTTATATPLNTSDRPNVTITPYDGGIRVTYDGEPLEDFEYDLEGPDGSVYNVSRDFSEATDWFQSDLNDSVTENASEDSDAYTIDWNATTTDGEELGGNLSVGENTGLTFGGSSDSSSSGGGGGIVPADSGSGAPIWLTAVPAIAGIGYVVYRNRRGGV